MPLSKKESALAEEILRLRDLAAVCYAGLCAELDLPEKWCDVFHAALSGAPFSTEGLLPFTRERDGFREAPKWAKWLAQSPNGDWFFYEKKPKCLQYIKGWDGGGRNWFAKCDTPRGDWRKMIVRVER